MTIKIWGIKDGMIKSVKYEDEKGTKILYLKKYIPSDNINELKILENAIDTVNKYIMGSKSEQKSDEKQ